MIASRPTLAHSFHQARVLRDLLVLADEHRVSIAPYKGLALETRLGGDAGTRWSGDIDLVIDRGMRRRWERVLEDAGWSPGYGGRAPTPAILCMGRHEVSYRQKGAHLDLHWALWERHDGPGFELKSADVSYDGECLGVPCRRFTSEALLIALARHGSRHNWARTQWAYDVARLIEREAMDLHRLDRLCRRACAHEVVRAAYVRVGAAPPEPLAPNVLRPRGSWRRRCWRLARRLAPNEVDFQDRWRWGAYLRVGTLAQRVRSFTAAATTRAKR